MKKITKAKYPEKTSINLAMREVEPGNNKMALVGFGIFLVALVVFVKLGVINPMTKAMEKESAYNTFQSQIDTINESLKDYDNVEQQYSRYSSGYLNEEELLVTNRIDALNLMEACVLNQADVQSVQITGNTMTVILSETNLSTVSTIVSALQNDARTSYVTVTTAASKASSESNSQLVTANIVIELAGTGNDVMAEETTEVGGNAE